MRLVKYLILLFITKMCVHVTYNLVLPHHCKESSAGTNFIVGLIGYKEPVTAGTRIHLHITPTLPMPTKVRVTAPYINMDSLYTVSNYTIVKVNGTLIQYEEGAHFKGIEVQSDANISLTVVTGNLDLMEGFLALPTNALGTRYVAASYYPYSTWSGEILIAGLESNTDISVDVKLNGNLTSKKSFRLQKFETYQLKSKQDVSGSIITSNKPVADFSGTEASDVPVKTGDWQYLIEQMIPTKYWTTHYIIAPIYPRKYFVLKFFADQDNTEVHYYNSTNHFAVYLKKGAITELLFSSDPVVVLANNPISVIQYGHDGDNIDGDPFMINVQGISQFSNSYKFVTQNFYVPMSNTLGIIVQKDSIGGLLLNGQSLSHWSQTSIPVSHPMEKYVSVFVNVSHSSYFHLYHNAGVKFGAVLYGRFGFNVAYGYALHIDLSDTECGNQAGHVSTSNYTHIANQGNGSWCFKCDDLTHLKYCDAVDKCKDDHEVCYVQRYTGKLGVNMYKSGCINKQQCSGNYNSSGCLECCSDNFCNSAGCGDNGFQELENRGPMCFDCSHKGENELCNAVTLCHSNQVCRIKMYEWGDKDYQYDMGCTDLLVCTSERIGTDRTVRNSPVCAQCCQSDFCNMNCSVVDTAPAIVG